MEDKEENNYCRGGFFRLVDLNTQDYLLKPAPTDQLPITHYPLPNQMIELAQTYLGNIVENTSLSERISLKPCLEVYLTQTDSAKGRIHAYSTSGIEVGIIKNRDWSLREGDIFTTEQGKLLLIHLQEQKVIVLSFRESLSDRPIELIHLGHVLGNHHWPILVQDGKLYVQLAVDAEVIEATIRSFQIPGLQIDDELRSPHEHLTFSEHHH